ncbi:hypothetical protein AJ88_45080 [Mesorhizobium amorphae CCBAU 01583]|nr:hypothetical protein AJ88_45080 [Mesorhizobium amorphae CCBAU 01583]
MRDLHAALRNGRQQPLGLEARHDLADGAKRQPREGDQLALRHELPGPEVTRQEMPREAGIRLSLRVPGSLLSSIQRILAGQAGSVANSRS